SASPRRWRGRSSTPTSCARSGGGSASRRGGLLELRREGALRGGGGGDRGVPEGLGFVRVGDLFLAGGWIGRVRVLRVGVRVVGLEEDAVVAELVDHVVDDVLLALGRDPAVALPVLEGRPLALGRVEPARELEVLLDAPEPEREPAGARLH